MGIFEMNMIPAIQEVQEALALIGLLLDDMETARQLVESEIAKIKQDPVEVSELIIEKQLQPLLRVMTRSSFAALEGICYRIKNLALVLCNYKGIPVTQQEQENVLEKRVNQDGKEVSHYLETLENMKFSFKMLNKSFGKEYIMVSHDKWMKMRKAVEIRNRITHPKNLADMKISGADYLDESVGFEWFSEKLDDCLSQSASFPKLIRSRS